MCVSLNETVRVNQNQEILLSNKMSEKKRATCWRNRAEWAYVYKMLYCFEDENNQRKALSIVDVWRSRHCAKLPIAVECTANLIAAKIGLGSTSSRTKSLSIAMALIRFVNGMVDQGWLEFSKTGG